MRDRIVFFILGAIVSVASFQLGVIKNEQPTPSADVIECKKLRVEESIWIGDVLGGHIVLDVKSEEEALDSIAKVSIKVGFQNKTDGWIMATPYNAGVSISDSTFDTSASLITGSHSVLILESESGKKIIQSTDR